MADDVAGPGATRHPNRMIWGPAYGKSGHAAVQLRGSSRLGDGSVALECDRSCVVTSRAHFSFDGRGAAAMIALFSVGPSCRVVRRALTFLTFREGFYTALELRRSQSVAFTTAVATTSLVMK